MLSKLTASIAISIIAGVVSIHQVVCFTPSANAKIFQAKLLLNAQVLAASDLKKISNIDLAAIDIHKFKIDFVGVKGSNFDTYVDNNGKGSIILVNKSDTKITVPTGYTVQEAKDGYPISGKK